MRNGDAAASSKAKTLTFECRNFGGNIELSSQYAAELVNAQVDVIEAYGVVAIRAAQQATKTIPILGIAEDMVGEGLVELDGPAKWQYNGRQYLRD